MRILFALVTVALLSISTIGSALAQQTSQESGILFQPPTDEGMERGTTLSFSWFLRSLLTQDGCFVVVYHFPKDGFSEGESTEDYKVVQLTTPFGVEVEVPGYSDDFIVRCKGNGQLSITMRLP